MARCAPCPSPGERWRTLKLVWDAAIFRPSRASLLVHLSLIYPALKRLI